MRSVITLISPQSDTYLGNTNSFTARYETFVQEDSAADFGAGILTDAVVETNGSLRLDGTPVSILEDFEDTTYQLAVTGDWALTSNAYAGSSGLASTNHTNASESNSYLDFTLQGAFTVSFWYMVSSEANFDKFYVYVDDVVQVNGVSGTIGWTQVSYALAAGPHQIRLRYTKDGSASSGSDLAAIDNLQLEGLDFVASGNRYSPGYPVLGTATAESKIRWTATTPAETSLAIKVAVTASNVQPEDSAYLAATNGEMIPGLSVDEDLTGKYIWLKEELATTDSAVTPTIQSVDLDLNQVDGTVKALDLYIDRLNLPANPSADKVATTVKADIPANTTVTWENVQLPKYGYWFWNVTTDTIVPTPKLIKVAGVQSRTLYQYENVGVKLDRFTNKRALYQYENVGVQLDRFTDMRALYLYENIIAYVPTRRVVIFI